MILIPFAALRLWLLSRKLQEQSGVTQPSGATGDIIDAEYTVIDNEPDR